MQENRTAFSGDYGVVIIAQRDDDVIDRITPPELQSVVERRAKQLNRKVKQERQAAAVFMYVSGKLTAEEAAEIGQTSVDYLWRIARATLNPFGLSPRNLSGCHNLVRQVAAEDARAALDGTLAHQHGPHLVNLWNQVRETPRRPLKKFENLAKTAYLDLLPWVVLGDVAISEVAAAKGTPIETVKRQLHQLLVERVALSVSALESLPPPHLNLLADILLRLD
jgi:hypothetical protein